MLGLEFHNRTCKLFKILVVYACLDLLYKDDLGLGDVEYEILVLIGEEVLNDIVRRNLVSRNNAYKEYNAADICVEVQFSCLERDIAGENVIKNEIGRASCRERV